MFTLLSDFELENQYLREHSTLASVLWINTDVSHMIKKNGNILYCAGDFPYIYPKCFRVHFPRIWNHGKIIKIPN